jgi:hypothetical protein
VLMASVTVKESVVSAEGMVIDGIVLCEGGLSVDRHTGRKPLEVRVPGPAVPPPPRLTSEDPGVAPRNLYYTSKPTDSVSDPLEYPGLSNAAVEPPAARVNAVGGAR